MSFHPEVPNEEVTNVVIAGLGAQAKYTIETFRKYENIRVKHILDIKNKKNDSKMYGISMGQFNDDKERFINDSQTRWIVCHRDNTKKAKILRKLNNHNVTFINSIHPDATIASNASLGVSNVINSDAIIQPYATVGNGCMIHANSIIEHDCEVESFANLSPNVTLAGHVSVKKNSYIYTSATITPEVTIGKNSVVGAGAVVLEDVDEADTVVGIPAETVN